MPNIVIYHEVKENTTVQVRWIFQDPSGVPVLSASLSSVTLTLYNLDDNTIINNRDSQDILGGGAGANNVAIGAGGDATWVMQPADNVIVSNSLFEIHVALIQWVWDPEDGGGDRYGKEEIQFIVKNLTRVP